MMNKQYNFLCQLMLLIALFMSFHVRAAVLIQVDPECTRSIQGVSDLDRKVYFSMSDRGTGFDDRCDDEIYDDLINELGVFFGRRLGVVKGIKGIEEDPERPGYANIELLKKHLSKRRYHPSAKFINDRGNNLDVAAHGNHNSYPKFMGEHTTKDTREGKHAEYLPQNIDAAAELAAAVLKYGYSDFDRPAYFEPINEPHWGFFKGDHLADWHMKAMQAVHALTPEVQVGGFCMSVSYMYRDTYRVFRSFVDFIDRTDCQMDFYSFHVYDFFHWDGDDFHGRVTGGLPLEGVLDILPNYTFNKYGKEIPIVVSEQGGYVNDPGGDFQGALATLEIANKHFPGSGFQWDMKRRSIVEFIHVSTIIANTMVFMDHPHVIKKSVPFLLFDAHRWDPKYYASLYVPYEFKDTDRLVPTRQLDFFKLFKGLNGRRIKALCSDSDIQTRACVDGSSMYLVLNNLADKSERLDIQMPRPQKLNIRRFGRNDDFTPYYIEKPIDSAKQLTLAGRETIVLVADYGTPIDAVRSVNERPCYGNRVDVAIKDEEVFTVSVPDAGTLDYASLRIGMSRPADADRGIQVKFNGNEIFIPVETCAERLADHDKRDYASCKIVPLPVELVEKENKVKVAFNDDKPGSVGSVVIRAAVKK
ncbi:MAG: beta-agarase [Planctomycetota bacterium]|jgi:hypothetical protein